ncbi:hypothetical protein BCR41DRAFT_361194 [Lobosporangium transversale]|uniref:F-box domain-containing protein n=1 Tax=Lobosporangium transversale TaxID=64571 RepID=A0A1Y2GB49_9FUNG|nr:hypothetical protein BCR41DRAFT_361194 [Lobosporangium transversale]ORZ06089.1 hypothetical protein BCR41DRAFT_361194 [Lobosporangium transversale]|eukprot:XP_021877358.1 hypothetical protein BCR41DRAFT_361194 [Lobosporangium transversale]
MDSYNRKAAVKQQHSLSYAKSSNGTRVATDLCRASTSKQYSSLLKPDRTTTSSSVPAVESPKDQVPVNELVQLGRQAFAQKNFATALQYLTRALAIAPKDINLLDSRAASYEKLNRLDGALADAKSMIRYYPQNPKGYLRAGKTLRLQQNFKNATKYYTVGIERCVKGSKEYEALVRIATEIAKRELRILDPMERLPLELIAIIFSHLTFVERVRCLTVSKKWEEYLGSIKKFWLTIDVTNQASLLLLKPHYAKYAPPQPDQETNNKITNKTILRLTKYTAPKVLQLGCAQQLNGAFFKDLIFYRRVSALEVLSLRENPKIYEQEFTLFWKSALNIRSLDLYGCRGVTDKVVILALELLLQLEELNISECRITEASFMINSMTPMPSMKKLIVGTWESQFAKEGIDALVARFPNLITLDIRTMRPRGIEALEGISGLRHLKHLYTESIETSGEHATNAVLHRWVVGIPELESLQMNACKGISDTTIQIIANASEPGSDRHGWSNSLRMLDLSSSPYLTCAGLEHLHQHPLHKLHTLLLNKCGRVSEYGLRRAVKSCGAELSRLECSGYSSVSDKLMVEIAQYCPKIEMVHLANSGMVTGIGLLTLVHARGQSLERICLDDCPAVGIDAVELAREMLGSTVRVSHRFHRSHRY